jgi:hypothetical protein
MVQQANHKCGERSFNTGDLGYLKLQLYRQKSVATKKSQKLATKYSI